MLGASFYTKYGDEGGLLDADFRQFYGLDFFENFENSRYRALMLAANLPRDSRCMEETIGGEYLSHGELMLTNLEFLMSQWVYGHVDEKNKNSRDEPKLNLPQHYKKITEKDDVEITKENLEDFKSWLYEGSYT